MKNVEETVAEKLQAAFFDTVSELGVGGYVDAAKFPQYFEEIDAYLFAQIVLATEEMLLHYKTPETKNLSHVQRMIDENNFERDRVFPEICDRFRRHFGDEIVRGFQSL